MNYKGILFSVTDVVCTISIPILQELYSESHENVCVMFASIYGWDDYYDQTGINDSGMECLRLLNEIMWDFDEVGRAVGGVGGMVGGSGRAGGTLRKWDGWWEVVGGVVGL